MNRRGLLQKILFFIFTFFFGYFGYKVKKENGNIVLVQNDSSNNDRAGKSLVNEMKALAEKSAEIEKQIQSQFVNVLFPPSPLIAYGPNKTDSENTTILQEIINYASTNNKNVYLPSGYYTITAPLSIPSKQGFELRGAGNRNTVICPRHKGNVIEIVNGQSHVIKDIKIEHTASSKDKYTGIYVKDSLLITIDNVSMFFPENGIVFEGGVYVSDVSNLYIYYFKKKGIYLKSKGTKGYPSPNGNSFLIKFIRGYSMSESNSYGIYIENGSVNNFSHGQLSDCDTAIYSAKGIRNYFEKFWIENTKTHIEILSGTAHINSHGTFINKISEGATIFTDTGQASPYSDLTKNPMKEDNELKAMWFFNEGSGSTVLDKSGNKKHITLQGTPTWVKDGSWGTGVHFKHSDGRKISIPIDTVDWTQPYTFIYNYSVFSIENENASTIGLYLSNSNENKYFSVGATVSSISAGLYNGVFAEWPRSKPSGRYTSKTTKNIWQFIYVDPTERIVELLDPYGETARLHFNNNFPVTTPTSALITGREHKTNTNEGIISMAGFFQRKLSISEVYDIVNSPVRPFQQFDKSVQFSTILVSPNNLNYKLSVNDDGTLITTLI
ncbi:glycosyl hydrolase family 28-related protein [Peribacillus huizhouensis]|uniref:Pectate lyase superfamily protein domain-containing protein n=1 Tax=Peribacillus huizhouensis TaxID=1501239 RepID=A0ABR6CL45_9BACI|nr:glycosyl hydrolase family 28-related protein [Peribacillus huizhouensis]MBA9025644.1 hypothetical protein [Peribacillus huizhouensis]